MIGPHHHHSTANLERTTDHLLYEVCIWKRDEYGGPCWCPQGHPYDEILDSLEPILTAALVARGLEQQAVGTREGS